MAQGHAACHVCVARPIVSRQSSTGLGQVHTARAHRHDPPWLLMARWPLCRHLQISGVTTSCPTCFHSGSRTHLTTSLEGTSRALTGMARCSPRTSTTGETAGRVCDRGSLPAAGRVQAVAPSCHVAVSVVLTILLCGPCQTRANTRTSSECISCAGHHTTIQTRAILSSGTQPALPNAWQCLLCWPHFRVVLVRRAGHACTNIFRMWRVRSAWPHVGSTYVLCISCPQAGMAHTCGSLPKMRLACGNVGALRFGLEVIECERASTPTLLLHTD
jgi:hypothetical protein